MINLLVSVRSVREAEAALRGGAALIDVKEPNRGSLGRATTATIGAVIRSVSGRRPVSAALGELLDCLPGKPGSAIPKASGLAFAKWGLAGCALHANWRARLAWAGLQLRHVHPGCRPVAVAYADWQRARAPQPSDIVHFIADNDWDTLLIDTWGKDGTTLLDWLPCHEIARLRFACEKNGVRLALAGSLGPIQLTALLPVAPDWFAVRGAVCYESRREASIDESAVRQLVDLLTGATVS